MIHKSVLFLLLIITQSDSQNINTILLSKLNDVRYQCLDPGCSTPTIISGSNLKGCQMSCLRNINCRTLTFDQSNNQCEIFADIPSQYGNLITQVGVVTWTAVDTRQLSAPMTTSTTTSTTSATSTTTTSSSSSSTSSSTSTSSSSSTSSSTSTSTSSTSTSTKTTTTTSSSTSTSSSSSTSSSTSTSTSSTSTSTKTTTTTSSSTSTSSSSSTSSSTSTSTSSTSTTTKTTTTTSSSTSTTTSSSSSSTSATTSTSTTAASTTASTTTSTTATTATTTATTTVMSTCPISNATANQYLSPGTPLFSTSTVNTACGTYFSVAWLYIAQSANETITITTYNPPGFTIIDDVSIFDVTISQELLTNGGFENGTSAWSGAALSTIAASGSSCHNGSWCYRDGTGGLHGSITQSVNTTVGHTLFVSFYINWSGSGTVYNNITITP